MGNNALAQELKHFYSNLPSNHAPIRQEMNEAEIRAHFIDKSLENAGWTLQRMRLNIHLLLEELGI